MVDPHAQRLLRATILLLVTAAVLVGLVGGGVFDPRPLGSLRWQINEQRVTASANSREIRWLEEDVPPTPVTVRVSGALEKGEEDSGYGLVVGDGEAYFTVAVSPLGYLAIWETTRGADGEQDAYLLQWQTWPHVKTGGESNEMWLDVAENRATVRVNREWLWEGKIGSAPQQIGLLVESFGDEAVVAFADVALFTAEQE